MSSLAFLVHYKHCLDERVPSRGRVSTSLNNINYCTGNKRLGQTSIIIYLTYLTIETTGTTNLACRYVRGKSLEFGASQSTQEWESEYEHFERRIWGFLHRVSGGGVDLDLAMMSQRKYIRSVTSFPHKFGWGNGQHGSDGQCPGGIA